MNKADVSIFTAVFCVTVFLGKTEGEISEVKHQQNSSLSTRSSVDLLLQLRGTILL